MLSGLNIALGVTGSIAAVRVVELAHELRRRGASVRAVVSESATGIIHPSAVQYATGSEVVTALTGDVEHIELCGESGWADVLLIAPATANTIGKMAAAIDDTPVTTCATTAIGAGHPVVVAPAMHEPMSNHPGVEAALDRLESWGVLAVPPRIEEGKAKIAEHDTIAIEVARAAGPTPLSGRHVVVTSGATAEPIDPVRVLTSRASGRTGRAIARACYAQGADVTLVHEGGSVPYASVRSIDTAADLREAVFAAVESADAMISAAAISDYTVEAASEKLRSGRDDLTLSLEPTPKLLDALRSADPDLPMVGFKVETVDDDEALIRSARNLLERADLRFVVANHADVMGEEETRALLVDDETVEEVVGSKAALGTRVAETLADELG